MSKAVVGLYDDFNTAQMVTQDLESSGFSRNDINLVAKGDSSTQKRAEKATDTAEELRRIGVPQGEVDTYAEGIRRGGSLVAITVADERTDEAAEIMERHVPIDVNQRMSMWKQQGWTGYDRSAKPLSDAEIRQERDRYRSMESQGGETTIPVVEEELHVGKRQVQHGGTRIHTYVTERPVEEQVRLREEHVDVERRPVDRPASAADQAFREETFDVTEMSEEAVVQKRARVIEEVVIRKDVSERTETVRDTVRHTDVDVEQINTERAVGQMDFHTHDADFRNRYNANVKSSGYTYEEYAPVYQYGYSLGNDQQYSDRNWSKVEPEARRLWEERNPGTWDQFKSEVKYAWEKARKR